MISVLVWNKYKLKLFQKFCNDLGVGFIIVSGGKQFLLIKIQQIAITVLG